MPILEVRNGLKAFVLGTLMLAMGVATILLSDDFSHKTECTGRHQLICQMLSDLPVEGRLAIWIILGLLFAYVGVIIVMTVLRRRPILRLDTQGVMFDFGSEVLLPWAQISSFEVKYKSAIFMLREPVVARNMLGWRRSRSKIAIPLNMGKARIDGKKVRGKAVDAVVNWLKLLSQAAVRQNPVQRIEPRLS